jgi:hypothetical protein
MSHIEELKSLQELLEPDVRSTVMVFQNVKTGVTRNISIGDLHRSAAAAKLKDYVSPEIRSHFATAQNLSVFGWFVYRFHPVAELHALSSLEFALREKIKPTSFKERRFKTMFKFAVENNWIEDKRFEYVPQRRRTAREYRINGTTKSLPSFSHWLAEYLPDRRNDPAHGSNSIMGESWKILDICADLINQIFDPAHETNSRFNRD